MTLLSYTLFDYYHKLYDLMMKKNLLTIHLMKVLTQNVML
jgi:hypothetical protein